MVDLSRGRILDFFVPQDLRNLAQPVILLVLLLIYYAEGPLIFGSNWSALQQPMTFYLFLAIGALVITPALVREQPTYGLVAQFIVFLAVTMGINTLLFFSGARYTLIGTSDYWSNIFLQVAIANTEELFFRAALFRIGPFASSGLFAGFHLLVYGLNPVTVILAFVAGIAFYYAYKATKDYLGTAVDGGLHTGYNLALLGTKLLPF